ncbi:MAG: methylated-DNA--[protein]-cysteine S-methyltransferase [Balneolaceae bacterium]
MELDHQTEQNNLNYRRIARAIEFIESNFKDQPSLDEIAASVHLSPHHFQRLFTEWAGTSPKKFLQFITAQYAKSLLTENNQATLFDAAHQTGLSGTSRLHDLFVSVEGMSPSEFKQGGKNLAINYSFAGSPFGKILVASTEKGVCFMAFVEDEHQALDDLKMKFPNATFQLNSDDHQQNALSIFRHDRSRLPDIKLHLKGTPFQLNVWEALLKIPMGKLSTYGRIAESIENPRASRAVGSAIGRNPVAYLIPCHRVIQSTGKFGGYMWGATRKAVMIGWEGVRSVKR